MTGDQSYDLLFVKITRNCQVVIQHRYFYCQILQPAIYITSCFCIDVWCTAVILHTSYSFSTGIRNQRQSSDASTGMYVSCQKVGLIQRAVKSNCRFLKKFVRQSANIQIPPPNTALVTVLLVAHLISNISK